MFKKMLHEKPTFVDSVILSLFTIFITLQPYFLHHEIIMMETGNHLPAINALFNGQIPYRDFLYLRGPVELFVPALQMKIFGINMIQLPIFYYFFSVFTLIVCVFIGKQLFKTRFILYLFIPVLIARTWPRVSYYYWGGLRYALGFLTIYFCIRYFKTQKKHYIFTAGVFSSLALFTTVEAGVSCIVSVLAAIIFSLFSKHFNRKQCLDSILHYFLGVLSVALPIIAYLLLNGAFIPMLEKIYTVVFLSNNAMPGEPGTKPEGIGYLLAMIPGSKFFKFMTPAYLFLIFCAYAMFRMKKNKSNAVDSSLMMIAIYGFILFAAAFRKIEGHHFEMAVQPQMIIFFYFYEIIYFWTLEKRKNISIENSRGTLFKLKVFGVYFLLIGLIFTPWGTSIRRFNKRFPIAKIIGHKLGYNKDMNTNFLWEQEKRKLNIDRAKGMTVPTWQADEIEGVTEFLLKNTEENEKIFCYPEVGNFGFFANRPFVGKFPIVTYSWFQDKWHDQIVKDFIEEAPRYVIMTKIGHRTFPEEWYFRNPENKVRFNQVTQLILQNYVVVQEYEAVQIYKRKNS